MVASTESFLLYFAVKQNVTSIQLAILSTLPLFLGALAQLVTPKLIPEKNLGESIVWTMLIQIIGVLGILYTATVNYQFGLLLFFSCIHFIGGLASTPLWIDWASRIIPKRNFRKYMANRSSYTWYLILFFYISMAFLGEHTTWFKLIYVFLIGAIARIVSCLIQMKIIRGDFSKKIKNESVFADRKSTEELSENSILSPELKKLIWVFILWTAVFKFGVYISTPFFVPYMVNNLKLTMSSFVLLSSIPYFGRALFFNKWGKAGKGHDAFFGIHLTMLYISFIPIIWIATRNYYILILTEIVAGMAWGGFELNQVLMIQNFMHKKMLEGSRVLLGIQMAMANFFSVFGAIIGSYLLDNHYSFNQVFFISAAFRFIVSLILILKVISLKKNNLTYNHLKTYLKNFLPQS